MHRIGTTALFTTTLAGLALALTACAKDPGAIPAINMPVNAYSGLTCEQLAEEFYRSSIALQQVSADQKQAVAGDAFGVFLIGVPISSLSGADKEGLVAQHKGELIAIEHMQRNNKCEVQPLPGLVTGEAPPARDGTYNLGNGQTMTIKNGVVVK